MAEEKNRIERFLSEIVKGMKRRSGAGLIICVMCLLFIVVEQTLAQSTGEVELTIQLRYSDGTAVTREPIILQRLPEEELIVPALRQAQDGTCTTDTNGECTWTVGRGLYQLLFERPLDNISALAVAEGGLRGLGITVGDEAVTYHFTFHSDDSVYFDAAPEAVVPSPIIPEGDVLHGGIMSTPALSVIEDEPAKETPTPEPSHTPETAVDTATATPWRFMLLIAGGLVIGGSLHFLRRRSEPVLSLSKEQVGSRKRPGSDGKTTRLSDEETNDA